MLKVAAFTGGQNIPSARYRVRQLIPELRRHAIQLDEFMSSLGAYPPASKLSRPFWAIATLCDRIPDIIRSYNHDLTFLQREFLSTLKTLEPFTKSPRVLDVDDAIWLNGDGRFAGRLATGCEKIICGNHFLADYFSQWNKNIAIIPTPVDTERFTPSSDFNNFDRLIIGWVGSHSNFHYLYQIEGALKITLAANPAARLRVVSDRRPSFTQLPESQLDYIPWSPETEVQVIQDLAIGIMPLDDTDWVRGKCSYKMLLYMACGIPVVVSPVGMNSQVLGMGDIGIGAKTPQEWSNALNHLLSLPDKLKPMGQKAREIVITYFSVKTLAESLASHLKEVAK